MLRPVVHSKQDESHQKVIQLLVPVQAPHPIHQLRRCPAPSLSQLYSSIAVLHCYHCQGDKNGCFVRSPARAVRSHMLILFSGIRPCLGLPPDFILCEPMLKHSRTARLVSAMEKESTRPRSLDLTGMMGKIRTIPFPHVWFLKSMQEIMALVCPLERKRFSPTI